MAWDISESSKIDVDEPPGQPGDGAFGDWIFLNPKEMCQYTVQRTDGTPSEFWGISIHISTDGARLDMPPYEEFFLAATDLTKSFLVIGPYAFRVKIYNAIIGPTDVVETDHYWRKDGVSL